MVATLRKEFLHAREITLTGTVEHGSIVKLADGQAGVVQESMGGVSGDRVAVNTRGIFDVPKASATTFADGAEVWLDASTGLAILASAAVIGTDFRLGKAYGAGASGSTHVSVDFNATRALQGPVASLTPAVEIAGADGSSTDPITLLDASDNPNGCLVFAAFGRVTEAPAGASEDQMALTAKDTAETPNTLFTLTTSATPDALDDVIQASGGVISGASSGAAITVLPAGVGVTATLTQPTAGAGAAGKLAVQLVVVPLS